MEWNSFEGACGMSEQSYFPWAEHMGSVGEANIGELKHAIWGVLSCYDWKNKLFYCDKSMEVMAQAAGLERKKFKTLLERAISDGWITSAPNTLRLDRADKRLRQGENSNIYTVNSVKVLAARKEYPLDYARKRPKHVTGNGILRKDRAAKSERVAGLCDNSECPLKKHGSDGPHAQNPRDVAPILTDA